MSDEAITWSLKQQVGDPATKFVLVVMARRATLYVNELFSCELDVDDLVRDCEIDPSGVLDALEKLRAAGLIETQPAPTGRVRAILGDRQ